MSSNKNMVQLTGFAGNDTTLSKHENQLFVAKLRLAVNEYYKTKDGEDGKQTQ